MPVTEDEEEPAHVNVDISDDPLDHSLGIDNTLESNNSYMTTTTTTTTTIPITESVSNSNNNSAYFYHTEHTASLTVVAGASSSSMMSLGATSGSDDSGPSDWKHISVVDPRKENEGAFITYRIVSSVC